MILREVLVRPGIVDSAKVCALAPATQLFFRNVLHVCDGAGRFEADADRLRTVLYGRALDRVSRANVSRWLIEIQQAGLIDLYTEKGRGYGEVLNYGQRDSKRRVRYPARMPADAGELPLTTGDPPPRPRPPRPPRTELNGREVSEPAREARGPHSTGDISTEEWLAALAGQYPRIDLRAEYMACLKKYPKAGRQFFANSWLPNWEPPMRMRREDAIESLPEPEGFVAWHTERYEKAPSKAWQDMGPDMQAYWLKMMRQ